MKIIFGTTKHVRFLPRKHEFSYPLYMLECDIDELSSTHKHPFFFGYNRKRLLSIYDKDYLKKDNLTLAQKVQKITNQFKLGANISQVKMVAIPRFIARTFRPVSFYLLYSDTSKLLGMFAEVSNTYKETSYYKLEANDHLALSGKYTVDKDFHVSPFFDETGKYFFKVINEPKKFELHINYEKEDDQLFYANFIGKKEVLNLYQIMKLIFIYPLTLALIFPRIMYQAFLLFYLKRLPARSKPPHRSPNALRQIPVSSLQRKILKKIETSFSGFDKGILSLVLPDKTLFSFGRPDAFLKAHIEINTASFFTTIRRGGEIGFGESYMKGEWDTPDLVKVIEFMIMNMDTVDSKFRSLFFITYLNRFRHVLRANNLKNSRKNITEHYDLGNSFFRLFLDKTMMYSSGLFQNEEDTLEASQVNKVNRLIDGLNLKPTDHVLEIGTGWGYVATKIVQKYGCKVTTVTLSKEQHAHAKQNFQRMGVDHLASVKIQDYRDVEGVYDAIISIEMIEAVGHDYLPTYFSTCNKLLKPNGVFALQVITYPDTKYKKYCKDTDFIRKHVFPGGHLPSLGFISDIVKNNTQMKEVKRLNIAQSYAKTLKIWQAQFIAQKSAVSAMGFNEIFFRKWVYYLSYCEAAFKQDYIGCYQIHFKKDGVVND